MISVSNREKLIRPLFQISQFVPGLWGSGCEMKDSKVARWRDHLRLNWLTVIRERGLISATGRLGSLLMVHTINRSDREDVFRLWPEPTYLTMMSSAWEHVFICIWPEIYYWMWSASQWKTAFSERYKFTIGSSTKSTFAFWRKQLTVHFKALKVSFKMSYGSSRCNKI